MIYYDLKSCSVHKASLVITSAYSK